MKRDTTKKKNATWPLVTRATEMGLDVEVGGSHLSTELKGKYT